MKSLSKALLALYLLVLIWLILFKLSLDLSITFAHQNASINMIPFAFIHERGNLREIIYNCAAFIPFGLLLSVNLKKAKFRYKLVYVFVLSLALEIAQFVFAIGASDITDVITNTFGGFIGLISYDFGKKHISNEKFDKIIVIVGTIVILFFIVLRFVFFNVRFQSAH